MVYETRDKIEMHFLFALCAPEINTQKDKIIRTAQRIATVQRVPR